MTYTTTTMFPESSKPAAAAGSKTGGLKSKLKMSMRVTAPLTASKGKGKAQQKDDKPDHDDDDDEEDAMSVNDNAILLEEDEPDTEDEFQASKGGVAKSKKTAKRKRRATSPNSFGLALESLLGTAPPADSDSDQDEEEDDEQDVDKEMDAVKPKAKKQKPALAQGSTILSLAPHLRRSAQSTALNARASRIAIEQRRAREERARVKDIIGGWGPPGELPLLEGETRKVNVEDDAEKLGEWVNQGGNQGYERRLRKVAQRGVVKLFNAIRAAQSTTTEDLDAVDSKSSTAASSKLGANAKKPVIVLGSKEHKLADLSKNNFLDLIRKGSKVAATAK